MQECQDASNGIAPLVHRQQLTFPRYSASNFSNNWLNCVRSHLPPCPRMSASYRGELRLTPGTILLSCLLVVVMTQISQPLIQTCPKQKARELG